MVKGATEDMSQEGQGQAQVKAWTEPIPNKSKGLRIYNSLARAKVPFHASDLVTWYICGPTVYDSSHVGHARNYVTFDILRRILEGFFKYHVHYVMNVTDVDDKIISKARRNYLLDQFLSTASHPNEVISILDTAFEEEYSKQESKPMNFSESVMSEAIAKERQFLNFFKIVKNILRRVEIDGESYVKGFENVQKWGQEEKEFANLLAIATSQVRERLEDNFDTPGALQALLNLSSGVHSYVDKRAPYINAACSLRDEIRAAAKDDICKAEIISITDQFRDYKMVDLGVRIEDSSSGTVWELCDVETLKNERSEKFRKTQEATIKSLQMKIDQKSKDIENFQLASIDPKDYFQKQTTKYSKFDDRGLPTHDSEGKELSKKAMKDAEKLMKKAESRHEKYKEKLAVQPLFIENLKSEVKDLQEKLQKLESCQ